MVKALTNVGNSKAVILPAELVKRYNLEYVIIEATPLGILIRPAKEQTSFQKKMEVVRANKEAIYKKMQLEANNPDTIAYYDDKNNTFENLDLDTLES